MVTDSGAGRGQCALCDAIDDEMPAIEATSGEAVVLHDLAPVVPGHVLVVTKQHYLAVGSIDRPDVLRAVIHELWHVRAAVARDGRAIMFEHGPRRRGAAGSCVDHAHVHVLPVPMDVAAPQLVASPALRSCGVSDWRHLPDPFRLAQLYQFSSYLWVQDTAGTDYVAAVNDGRLPSQVLRRWAAEIVGAELWDWRTSAVREKGWR